MKKKILGSIAVIAIVAMAAVNINTNNDADGLSALSLANVEALASGVSLKSGYSERYSNADLDDGTVITVCSNPSGPFYR